MTDHQMVKPIPVSSLQYRPRDYFADMICRGSWISSKANQSFIPALIRRSG